ncbi:hypothetical protein Ddc_03428 [Ditylenchus destructor]|nr:hypothetical protein Ddc_03428 [Ditylenchus destructor]
MPVIKESRVFKSNRFRTNINWNSESSSMAINLTTTRSIGVQFHYSGIPLATEAKYGDLFRDSARKIFPVGMSNSNTFSKAILALMMCSLLCVVSEIEVKKKYPHPALGLPLSKAKESTSTFSPTDISPEDSSAWNWIIVIGVLIILVAIFGLCAACGMLEKCRAYISQVSR